MFSTYCLEIRYNSTNLHSLPRFPIQSMLALSNRVVPIVPRPLAVSRSVSSNTVVSTSVAGADANASDTLHWRRFGGTLVLGFLLRGRRGGVLCIVLSCFFFLGIPTTFLTCIVMCIVYCFASFFQFGFEARGAAAAARSGAAVPRRAWRRCRKRFQQLGNFFQTCQSKLKWSC